MNTQNMKTSSTWHSEIPHFSSKTSFEDFHELVLLESSGNCKNLNGADKEIELTLKEVSVVTAFTLLKYQVKGKLYGMGNEKWGGKKGKLIEV